MFIVSKNENFEGQNLKLPGNEILFYIYLSPAYPALSGMGYVPVRVIFQ
jgi:hypothetical protein